MDTTKMLKVFNLNKQLYDSTGREIRLEFYPDDDYSSVTLYDITEGELDIQLGLDEAIAEFERLLLLVIKTL